MRLTAVLVLLLTIPWGACTKREGGSAGGGGAPQAVDLVAKGRVVYQSNCTACHHSDPTKNGPLGPEIAGSSLELLTARIMKAEYPPGYKPKRDTRQMAAIPQLQADIPAIHAYLSSLK
ncbi:MAG TPA: cytochrome c [Bdellovibrionota bacterium]|nr:cytochrome c [Bdellovibrionota bacterium]